jgi:FkbM family methyltransferase
MNLPPAYEGVQLEVERRLHGYLHMPAGQIERVVIVGANDGEEIHRIRKTYPNAQFRCFEPSPLLYRKLADNFKGTDFVECRELALSDNPGKAIFHELPLAGNGSLLRPDAERWSTFANVDTNQVTSFEVTVSTLDKELADLQKIDLLWIDVQGAEGNVLKGAAKTMDRVLAIFLEVALMDSPYQGALLYSELSAMLQGFGFLCVGLGTDGWNYSGNALWIRNPHK